MSNKYKCAVTNCQSENSKLFRCLESRNQLKKWKSILGVSENEFYVCELHFDANFVSYEKVLNDEAVPTIFINEKLLINQYCACCLNPINKGHQIGQLHLEIYRILFSSYELNGEYMCTNCNDKMVGISDFIKIVEDNRRTFDSMDVDMKDSDIKIEPPDELEVVLREDVKEFEGNMLFIKSELNGSDDEYQQLEEGENNDDELSEEEESKPAKVKRQYNKVKYAPRPAKNNGFKCIVCNEIFDRRIKISDHVFSVHGCDQDINKNFFSFDNFTKPTACDICEEFFTDKELLIAHFKTHYDKDTMHKCPYCEKSFKGITSLSIHRNQEHKIVGNFLCFCNRVFNDECEMKKCKVVHIKTQFSSYWCDECPSYIGFDSRAVLARHKTIEHGNGTRFWCTVCGKIHPTQKDSTKCQKNHKRYQESKIKCPHCEKKVRYKQYRYHFVGKHSESRDIICEICGKGFSLLNSLASHIKIMHDRKTYECDFCGYTCYSKYNIKMHLNLQHSPTALQKYREEATKCQICLKIFRSNVECVRHMEKNHPNNSDIGVQVNPETNKYHCSNCIQAFSSIHHYQKHVNAGLCASFGQCDVKVDKNFTTKTVGKFTCNVCKVERTTLVKLRQHVKESHTGQKFCVICNKTPKNLKQFQKHINKFHKISIKEYRAIAAEMGHVVE